MHTTLNQFLKYLLIKVRYQLTGIVPDYKFRLYEQAVIVANNNEKIIGKIVNIEKIEFDGKFICNFYEIEGEGIIYMIGDSDIFCAFPNS